MELVEGLCYTHPHYPELLATHPVMRGVWRKCRALLTKGAIMAPLLVDDRPQDGELCVQSVETLLTQTTNCGYVSFPWLGPEVSEAGLQKRYGALGCVQLDVLYHLHVLWSLALIYPDWKWMVVHPVSFQNQQSGMLAELWKRLAGAPDVGAIAGCLGTGREELRLKLRDSFLARFSHHWVEADGRVSAVTRPVWKGGKVLHESIATPATIAADVGAGLVEV